MDEPSRGKWVPRCLVEDEWTPQAKEEPLGQSWQHQVSSSTAESSQESSQIRSPDTDLQFKNLDSWEDLASPFEDSAPCTCTLEEAAPDSWEEREGDLYEIEWHSVETASIATTSIATTLDDADGYSIGAGSVDIDTPKHIECIDKHDVGPLERMMASTSLQAGASESLFNPHVEGSKKCAEQQDAETATPASTPDAPASLPLERLKTPNDYDYLDDSSQFDHPDDSSDYTESSFGSGHVSMHSAGLFADSQGVVWMASLVPVNNFINLPSYPSSAFQVPPAYQQPHIYPQEAAEPAPPIIMDAPNVTAMSADVAEPTPRPQVIDSYFNADTCTYRVLWHADPRQLQGKNCRLVSPRFELPLWEGQESAIFTLMVLPRRNTFAQSKRSNMIKLKCENDCSGFDATINFSIMIGSDVRGPFNHDFSSRPTAELQKGQEYWDLHVDSCKTVLIQLEVASASSMQIQQKEAPLPLKVIAPEQHGADSHVANQTERRPPCRSSAGKQRQRERHVRRLLQRLQNCTDEGSSRTH